MCDDVVKVEEETTTKYKNAEFVGGQDSLNSFIKKNLHSVNEKVNNRYNEIKVTVFFLVDTDGTLKNIQVADYILKYYPEFGREAIRAVSLSPKWIPASELDENGKRIPKASEELIDVIVKGKN
jgi:hypothetical protein